MAGTRDVEANQHLFPSAAKVLSSSIERDSTGLTGPQKTALISGWGIIKKDIYTHSKEIFIIFFDKYPKYLTHFDFGDDPINPAELHENHSLHAHALNVMNAIGTLIEFGLRDPILFECSIKKIVRNHHPRNVHRDDVRNLTDVMKLYFLDTLAKQSTQTLEEAVESFFIRICSAFETSTTTTTEKPKTTSKPRVTDD